MAKRQARQIDYQSLESRDLVWLVQVDGDQQASELLLERKDEVIKRLVKNCVRKYTFVDDDDLYQSMVLNFCKVIRAFRPGKKTASGNENGWDKFCYHKMVFLIKDILRQRDDLGIKWPQKKMYPQWFHLYDKSDSSDGCHADLIGDHRHLSEDAREQLEFYESCDELREALAISRELLTSIDTGNPASHKVQPVAWHSYEIGGKYCWLSPPDQFATSSTSTTKRKRSSSGPMTIRQWRIDRKKPKQIMMVLK